MSEASAVLGRFSDALKGAARVRLSARTRIGLATLAFAVLIAVRMPDVLLRGRFWAEEGREFFEKAWMLPWKMALLAPFGGYLNLTANVGGLLAWYVPPLAWAPYASTLFALAFQVCPAILLLTGRIAWLKRPWAMLAALLLIATPPATEEVWLSSIGTQCHLTLCAALILACATRCGGVGVFRLVLLALAALSGPGPWLLTPLFGARALLERSWRRVVQTAVLGAGVLVQALFFYSQMPGRTYALHPILFLDAAFTKHVLIPFLGPRRASPITIAMHHAVVLGHVPWRPAAFMALILVAGGAILAPMWRREPFWMALSAALLVAVSYFGSLGDFVDIFFVNSGGRYAFAPQVLIGLALLGCALTRRGVVRLATGGCVVWLLAVGILDYRRPFPEFAHGPSWRAELALHCLDPAHVVASWPPSWIVPLPRTLPSGACSRATVRPDWQGGKAGA